MDLPTQNKTTLVDTHTHSRYSGHGQGAPAEFIAEAARQGMWLIAQTEHLTFPFNLDPEGHISLTYDEVPGYLAEVAEARAAHPGLEVICGVEVDWADGAELFIREQLKGPRCCPREAIKRDSQPSPYELALGSVHVLTDDPDAPEGYWPLDYVGGIEGWCTRGADYVWREYLRLWLDAVQSGLFDIMAHPDLPKKLGFYPSFDCQPMWSQMAEAAAAAGLMIELNTAGLFMPVGEVYPGPQLLATFCRAGVPCTLSSDAHSPEHVGRARAEGLRALYEAGYRYLTVPRRDGDRTEVALTG